MAESQWDVVTAGITTEPELLNVADDLSVSTFFRKADRIDAIVCTAGINRSGSQYQDEQEKWLGDLYDQLSVNCVGPMRVLHNWLHTQSMTRCGHFVAISSNSAHVARSRSAGYCASKSALSMAVRCASRELAQQGSTCFPYVYEPGFLEGTPMSAPWEKIDSVSPSFKPHRIPSGHALDVWQVARVILDNLERDGAMLSGTCIRLDGGEQ
jgi:NAD(P)-dependent dehydrogenase (short-subunit alcohol dehydrogenase family)